MRTLFIALAFVLSAFNAAATPPAGIYPTVDNRKSVEGNKKFLKDQEKANAEIRKNKAAKVQAELEAAKAELKAAAANQRLMDEQETERPTLRSLTVGPPAPPKATGPKIIVPNFLSETDGAL